MNKKIPIDSHLIEFRFPEVKKHKLSNGLTLLIIERPELPKIYLRIGLPVGSKYDPPEKAGLSHLLALTIRKGTRENDYYTIMDTIERLGGELDTVVNEDFFFLVGEFLSNYLETGIKLARDILLYPQFPLDQVEKERLKIIADFENEKSSPQFLAQRRMDRALFAPHPYSLHKSIETIRQITREDLINFHNRFFSSKHAYLILSGNINESTAIRLAEKYFSNWKSSSIPDISFQPPLERTERTIFLVNRPGSAQSNILLGNLLFQRNHPDFEAMLVLNKILGGGGSGRLFMYLREKKGYTYGAYSTMQTFREHGAWIANAEVRTEVTADALNAFFSQFEKIKNEPVTEEEIINARRYLIGFFPLQNETPTSIAALALKQYLYDLPEDYWNKFLKTIANVSINDVQKMAQKYIMDDRMAIVIVGDAAKVQHKLGQFGYLELYDKEDKKIG